MCWFWSIYPIYSKLLVGRESRSSFECVFISVVFLALGKVWKFEPIHSFLKKFLNSNSNVVIKIIYFIFFQSLNMLPDIWCGLLTEEFGEPWIEGKRTRGGKILNDWGSQPTGGLRARLHLGHLTHTLSSLVPNWNHSRIQITHQVGGKISFGSWWAADYHYWLLQEAWMIRLLVSFIVHYVPFVYL